MRLVYFHLFIFGMVSTTEKLSEQFAPVFLWSGELTEGPFLTQHKVRNELFQSYLSERLRGKEAMVVMFVEKNLTDRDFLCQDSSGHSCFPYLSNLTTGVEYFPAVERPLQAFKFLRAQKYKRTKIGADFRIAANQSLVLKIDFRPIEDNRGIGLWKHDRVIKDVITKVDGVRKDWLAMFTARYPAPSKVTLLQPQGDGWCAGSTSVEEVGDVNKYLVVYKDYRTGFLFLTKGPLLVEVKGQLERCKIRLHAHNAASAYLQNSSLEFIIWFKNYTITIHGTETPGNWLIQSIEIENSLSEKKTLTKINNTAFINIEIPAMSLQFNKYLLTRTTTEEYQCRPNYNNFFPCFIAGLILAIIARFVASFAHKLVKHFVYLNSKSHSKFQFQLSELKSLEFNKI